MKKEQDKPKKKGFASMSPERLKEVSSKGGRGAAPSDRRFWKDREAAIECGRKGGSAPHRGKDREQ